MVTWPDAHQTAFEVEYKDYKPEDWALKQGDYDTHQPLPIACVWLLGHLRVKRPPTNSYAAEDPAVVRIPLLAQRWIAAGRVVVAINPATRQVGTIAHQYLGSGLRYPERGDTYGTLMVDTIDDCDLDPVRGLVSPAMKRIDQAIAERTHAAERQRELLASARRERADRERKQSQQPAPHTQPINERQRQLDRWNQSQIRHTVMQRWGCIPPVLNDGTPQSWGILAHPAHWHTVLYETHIHDKPAGHIFTLPDCWTTLRRFEIETSRQTRAPLNAITPFVETLIRERLIIRQGTPGGTIKFTVTGEPITVREPEPEWHPLSGPIDVAPRYERYERIARREAEKAQQAQQQRREAREAAAAARDLAWLNSDIRTTVAAAHGGTIPPAVLWEGGEDNATINAAPAHWHAHIYMTHIYGQPAGTPVNPRDAKETLRSAGIELPAIHLRVMKTIDAYLYNLWQRRILEHKAGVYTVLTDEYRQRQPPQPDPPSQPSLF